MNDRFTWTLDDLETRKPRKKEKGPSPQRNATPEELRELRDRMLSGMYEVHEAALRAREK